MLLIRHTKTGFPSRPDLERIIWRNLSPSVAKEEGVPQRGAVSCPVLGSAGGGRELHSFTALSTGNLSGTVWRGLGGHSQMTKRITGKPHNPSSFKY